MVMYSFKGYSASAEIHQIKYPWKRQRLIFFVKSEFLGKNYHIGLYITQNWPPLRTGIPVCHLHERGLCWEISSKRIAWLFSPPLKMSFNTTGYINISFDTTKIQSRGLVYFFLWILGNHKQHYDPKKQTFWNMSINRKKMQRSKAGLSL